MSLNDDTQAFAANMAKHAPAPVLEKVGAMIGRLGQAGIGASAPKVGDHAPDTVLTDASGHPVALSALHADQPVVLIFYRGRWCPFCDLTLRAFDKVAADIAAAGARLIGVSPQTAEETALTGSERNLGFDVMSDPHNAAGHTFGLAWAMTDDERELSRGLGADLSVVNGDDAWELPAPAAFVIDKAGVVRWASVDSNFMNRPEPDAVLAAVRAL